MIAELRLLQKKTLEDFKAKEEADKKTNTPKTTPEKTGSESVASQNAKTQTTPTTPKTDNAPKTTVPQSGADSARAQAAAKKEAASAAATAAAKNTNPLIFPPSSTIEQQIAAAKIKPPMPSYTFPKLGGWSKGGMIPEYFALGGFAKGTDTVPAMLTPGEFIMSKYAVDSYGVDNMRKINQGDSLGGAVYNNTYTLTVNAKTNANPNEIAQAVMSTIKQVDDRRIRGVNINGR